MKTYVVHHEGILKDKVNSEKNLLILLVLEGFMQVPDPYYGGEDGFEYFFQLIDTACNAIAKKIAQKP